MCGSQVNICIKLITTIVISSKIQYFVPAAQPSSSYFESFSKYSFISQYEINGCNKENYNLNYWSSCWSVTVDHLVWRCNSDNTCWAQKTWWDLMLSCCFDNISIQHCLSKSWCYGKILWFVSWIPPLKLNYWFKILLLQWKYWFLNKLLLITIRCIIHAVGMTLE